MTYDTVTQEELILEYFRKNPNRDIKHPEIVDWVTGEYRRRTGKIFRDPDRQIRKLHQEGKLLKISKGVYRYDPSAVREKASEDFTPAQKKEIFERDGYKCVICGNGLREGYELHADHIKPREFGGKAIVDNGQTLCSQHNMLKKTFNQTETGKKMFIRLYKIAKASKEEKLLKFLSEVLMVYEKNGINGHIKWER